MSPTRTRPPTRGGTPRRPATAPPPRSRRPLLVLAAVAAVVVLALVVAVAAGRGDGGSDGARTAAPPGPAAGSGDADDGAPPAPTPDPAGITVAGDDLPPLPDSGDDPATGLPMPVLSGTTLDGDPLTVPASGRPAIVLVLAHWCPHCQAEVPVVQRWVDGGGLPGGVDLATVSTAVDPRRPNHPPEEWLAAEGWSAPVLTDADDLAAAEAVGLTGFPYFVAVDAGGRVVERASGELTTGQLDDLAARLGGGAS